MKLEIDSEQIDVKETASATASERALRVGGAKVNHAAREEFLTAIAANWFITACLN